MHDYSEIANRLKLYAIHEPDHIPKPLSETTLAEVEQELGCRLPEDYREFLLQFGGSGGMGCLGSLGCCLNIRILSILYGYAPGNGYDLTKNYKVFLGRMPEEVIPFGADDGDNQFCLVVRGEKRGYVYSWFMEDDPTAYWGPPPMPDIWSNCDLCAPSFNEFLNSYFIDATV